jgi:DNA-binding CsgD family transcriptional regulator
MMSSEYKAPRPLHYRLRYKESMLEVASSPLLIGSGADCSIQLRDALVADEHARLEANDDALVVVDLGKSPDGVKVNDRRIEGSRELRHGDVIGIGLASLEVVDEARSDVRIAPPSPEPPKRALTQREREVLELFVLGHTQQEMAERLHLSIKTIETHRANLAEKLGCRTRAEIVSYAIRVGVFARRDR